MKSLSNVLYVIMGILSLAMWGGIVWVDMDEALASEWKWHGMIFTVVVMGAIAIAALKTPDDAGKKFWAWAHVVFGLLLTGLLLYPWPFLVQGHYLAKILILPVIYALLYFHYWCQEYEPCEKNKKKTKDGVCQN